MGKAEIVPELQAIVDEILRNPARFVAVLEEKRDFVRRYYATCVDEVENAGHRFGEDLSETDKRALTAFLATL